MACLRGIEHPKEKSVLLREEILPPNPLSHEAEEDPLEHPPALLLCYRDSSYTWLPEWSLLAQALRSDRYAPRYDARGAILRDLGLFRRPESEE